MPSSPLPPRPTFMAALGRSVGLVREHFAAFVTISLIFGAIAMVADLSDQPVLSTIVHLAVSAATSICVTWGALRAIVGKSVEWQATLRQMQGPHFGLMFTVCIAQYLAIAVSGVLVILPFFLWPLWAVALPAMMVERTDFAGAFRRSVELTRGRRLAILRAYVLFAVVFIAGGVATVAMLGDNDLSLLALWFYGSIASTVAHPLPALFYVMLREEKEGLTPAEIAAALD